MNTIVPTIWLNDVAEEAADFYCSVFDNARVVKALQYTDAGKEQHGHKAGDIMTVEFEVENMRFVALNGGPAFTITPAISFFVLCKDASEVDRYWSKLSEGGRSLMPLDSYPFSKRYGWIVDKFGVSWQLSVSEQEIQQKIRPSLLFTQNAYGKAEEAMKFYASVFPDSSVGFISHYDANQEPDKEGTVNYGEFTLLGQQMVAMDSARSHDFTFTEGLSLQVICETQKEIDTYWEALTTVPEAEVCGWLKDKYGVSWQIVPRQLNEMLEQGAPEQVERVTERFMKMKKLDIAELEGAYQIKSE